MKTHLLALAFCLLCLPVLMHAQTPQIVTMGQNYQNQVFVNFTSGDTYAYDLESWDIAFTADLFQVGIVVNEGVPNAGGPPPPPGTIELYESTATDFSSATEADITDRIFNTEEFWSKGAFNNSADPNNQLDQGWGLYNTGNNTVVGNKVFFIRLRDGVMRKI
ncbi:MAG: HmuY family protein, partial [Bacteroidota bacterium]